jgi:hypothetical protein
MPPIVFAGKTLQARPLYRWIPVLICMPDRSAKTPRKISQKDNELENLLRSAVRLRDAQKQAARTKTEQTTGSKKAR